MKNEITKIVNQMAEDLQAENLTESELEVLKNYYIGPIESLIIWNTGRVKINAN